MDTNTIPVPGSFVPERVIPDGLTVSQLRMIDVLDDTVNFYGADPTGRRAAIGTKCVYLSDDGRKCGVGRLLPEEGLEQVKDLLESVNGDTVKSVCAKYLPELSNSFLEDIQNLHDGVWNWDDTNKGLTLKGIDKYCHIFNNIVSECY